MRFANSIRLLMENFKQNYKLLLYKLVMLLVAGALYSAFLLPQLIEIASTPAVKGLWVNVQNVFRSFFTPELEEPAKYVEAIFGEGGSLKQVFDLLMTMRLELFLVALGCVLVYLVKRFIDTLCYFTVGSLLNDKMSAYAETPFWTAFVANLGKASIYALVYVPIVFAFDVCIFTICCFMLRFLPLLAALFLSITLIAVGQAAKLALTSLWMPAMTADNKKLGEAIRIGNKRELKQIGKAFTLYLVTVYSIIIVNAVSALFTFGSALLITIPASYLLLLCQQYVIYYTLKGKKYFITYESIATNPDHGDSEHFFEYIKEEEKVVNEENQE
ncbi:MAG: hypothetical protein IKB20_00400 [Clostridia bacterium]|nr:hypothetical protein [Clostridia bacterium]